MDMSEKRIMGSLILLLGLTFLSIGIYTGELTRIAELIQGIFEPAVAGLP